MSRPKGLPQYGGRKKDDPNIVHPYTVRPSHVYPKPSSERKVNKGGKMHITVEIPPELYDQILEEAKARRISFCRQAVEYISAGASPE